MDKEIITILGILIISFANAQAIYGGDSYSFSTNLTNPVYTVTGNSSDLTGLNVTFENGNITISTVLNYKPDSFTIIFFDNLTNEVIRTVKVGGGNTRVITENVTTYVPTTVREPYEVEVVKIVPVDNTTVLETGYELWHIGLFLLIGLFFGGWVIWDGVGRMSKYSQKSHFRKHLNSIMCKK